MQSATACGSPSAQTVRSGRDPSNGPQPGSIWNLRSQRSRCPNRRRSLCGSSFFAYLERVLHLTGQGTGIRQWRGVAYIEYKQHWSHWLQDYNRPGVDYDLPRVVLPPPTSGADEVCTWHLRVDQHRVEGRIEPKPTDEPHQCEVGIARIKLAGEVKSSSSAARAES
jgi:hypothetical protein